MTKVLLQGGYLQGCALEPALDPRARQTSSPCFVYACLSQLRPAVCSMNWPAPPLLSVFKLLL